MTVRELIRTLIPQYLIHAAHDAEWRRKVQPDVQDG
jgi:hypothetical protein